MTQETDIDAMVQAGEELIVTGDGNIEALVAEYRDLRDDLADARHQYQALEQRTKERLDQIAMLLKDIADRLGLNALPTNAGTAYRTTKEHYRVGNWDDILDYIKESGNFQMLEKRIGKLATQEIHRVTGTLPPGVEYSAEVEFIIRKN